MSAFSASPKSCVFQNRMAYGATATTPTAPSRRAHQHQGLPPGRIISAPLTTLHNDTVLLDIYLVTTRKKPRKYCGLGLGLPDLQEHQCLRCVLLETRKFFKERIVKTQTILRYTKNQATRCLGKWLRAVVCQEYFIVLCALRTCLQYSVFGSCARTAHDQHQHSPHQNLTLIFQVL